MKVLELGNNTKEKWSLVTSCSGNGNTKKGCESKLELEYSDLRFYTGREFPWRIESDAVCFKCPVCSAITDLEKEQWPTITTYIAKWSSDWHYRENNGEN